MKYFKHWGQLRRLSRDHFTLFYVQTINRMGTMVLPFIAIYLVSQRGMSLSQSGLLIGLYGLVGSISSYFGGMAIDRVSPGKYLRFCYAAGAIFLSILPFIQSFWGIAVCLSLYAVVCESIRPVILAIIGSISNPSDSKLAFSLNRLGINLGMSFGPAVAGFLYPISFHLLFVVNAVSCLAAALILQYRWKEKSKAQHHAAETTVTTPWTPSMIKDSPFLIFLCAGMLAAVVFQQSDSTLGVYLVTQKHLPTSLIGILFSVNTLMIVLFEIPLNSATSHWSHRRNLSLGAILLGLGVGGYALIGLYWHAVLCMMIMTLGEMLQSASFSAYVAERAPKKKLGQYMGALSLSWSLASIFAAPLGTALLDHFGSSVTWTSMLVISFISAALFWISEINVRNSGNRARSTL